MKIDFSPFKEQMDHMVIQLAIILFIPLIVGIIVKFILIFIKLPNRLANFTSTLVLLFVFYKTIQIVLG